MEYTVRVNNKDIKVPYKVYVAHCSMKFDFIQPLSTYNKFLRSYKLPLKNTIPFIKTYLDKDSGKLNDVFTNETIKRLSDHSNGSLLYLAAAADYIVTLNQTTNYKIKFLRTKLLEKYINYNKREFSKEYNSLQPLTQFYHSLIYEVDMNKTVVRKTDKFIKPTVQITDERIKNVLKELGHNIEINTIKKDIDNHAVLLDMGGYFVWSNERFRNWFWSASYNDVFLLNFTKLISMKVYN